MALKRRWWLYLAGVLIPVIIVAIFVVKGPKPRNEVDGPAVRFVDITKQAGIRFVHHSGATTKKLLPETMGSGVAVLDFDNDGHPDLLFINSRPWPGQEQGKPLPSLALYRNQGDGTFADMTEKAGLDISLFGMGVAVGDFDNDGWPDLFITGVGGNRLLRNEPAGEGKGAAGRRFHDVTIWAGIGGPGGWPTSEPRDFFSWKQPLNWSTSAAWVDYDGDGLLDLFVCNYLTWSPNADTRKGFRLSSGDRAYGPPRAFSGTQCLLYRNRGNGSFADVSRETGITVLHRGEAVGKSLGVAVCDVDEDGWPDIIVANDTVRNFFFHNRPDKDGRRQFREIGDLTGVAFGDRTARGAMGIDWGPGATKNRNALLISNFADEPDTFLVQQRPGDLQLTDLAPSEGIAGPSRPLLKFGLFFFDFDNDGRLDFLTCNGHLEPDIRRAQPDQSQAQPVQLFWNRSWRSPRFGLISAKSAGADLFAPLVGRGCAYLDMDGDGALDVVLTENGGPARLLRCDNRTGHHWLRLRLEGDGKRSNRSAIGARVIVTADGREQRREVSGARGYLSQSELTVTFGLGTATRVDKVVIHWPGRDPGPSTVIEGIAVDREVRVEQGKGVR